MTQDQYNRIILSGIVLIIKCLQPLIYKECITLLNERISDWLKLYDV